MDLNELPPELNNLPDKSCDKYLKVYNSFIVWFSEKPEEINQNVMFHYLLQESKKKAGTTLWSEYSIIKFRR